MRLFFVEREYINWFSFVFGLAFVALFYYYLYRERERRRKGDSEEHVRSYNYLSKQAFAFSWQLPPADLMFLK